METADLVERGMVDAVIVSGLSTGKETSAADLAIVRKASSVPVLIGSGVTAGNVKRYLDKADGFIVGSDFKKDGVGSGEMEEARVEGFVKGMKGKK
jgi:predicted TIM-barrel enzyme